jgi:hypothetical protein
MQKDSACGANQEKLQFSAPSLLVHFRWSLHGISIESGFCKKKTLLGRAPPWFNLEAVLGGLPNRPYIAATLHIIPRACISLMKTTPTCLKSASKQSASWGSAPIQRANRTVEDALTNTSWVLDIQGVITILVLMDFHTLWDILNLVELQPDVDDSHIFRLASNGKFSTEAAYEGLFLSLCP